MILQYWYDFHKCPIIAEQFRIILFNYGKFNIRYNGPILWNETDERFKILTPHSFRKELSMHFIKFY